MANPGLKSWRKSKKIEEYQQLDGKELSQVLLERCTSTQLRMLISLQISAGEDTTRNTPKPRTLSLNFRARFVSQERKQEKDQIC